MVEGLEYFGDDIDAEAVQQRQKERIEREDMLRAKAAEEVEKKKERIAKGKAEFEEALK